LDLLAPPIRSRKLDLNGFAIVPLSCRVDTDTVYVYIYSTFQKFRVSNVFFTEIYEHFYSVTIY